MEDFMEPSCRNKRKHSPSHENESKANSKVEKDPKVASLNEVSSTTNKRTRPEEMDDCWPDFLSEVELDLLVSVKKLAMERFASIEEECLQEILPASALRAIGVLMKELVKDRVRKLVLIKHTSSLAGDMSQGSKEDSVREI